MCKKDLQYVTTKSCILQNQHAVNLKLKLAYSVNANQRSEEVGAISLTQNGTL